MVLQSVKRLVGCHLHPGRDTWTHRTQDTDSHYSQYPSLLYKLGKKTWHFPPTFRQVSFANTRSWRLKLFWMLSLQFNGLATCIGQTQTVIRLCKKTIYRLNNSTIQMILILAQRVGCFFLSFICKLVAGLKPTWYIYIYWIGTYAVLVYKGVDSVYKSQCLFVYVLSPLPD